LGSFVRHAVFITWRPRHAHRGCAEGAGIQALAEAMAALEKGLRKWYKEQGIELQE
jgi:hypothetical protein